MNLENRKKFLNDFKLLSQTEKFEKILVYLHAMQKSENNLIWLYSIFEELWPENIDEEILNDLYNTVIDITFIWKEYEESGLDKISSILKQLQTWIINDIETNTLLQYIDNL